MIENKFTMVELFSGIGAQERALRQLNIPYEIKHTCDCDKDVILSYAAMRWDLEKEIELFEFPSQKQMVDELQAKNVGFDFQIGKHTITMKTPIKKLKQYYIADKLSANLGDISKVEKLPYADMVTYSFCCQDLSAAGKGEGMKLKCDKCGHSWLVDFENPDNNNICQNCGNINITSTRSGLLSQVQRLLGVAQTEGTLPKYLILENVKNLIGKKFKPQFDSWVKWLDNIGYNTYYQVCNAKNCGIPQNRERVFAISIRKDVDTKGFTFPETIPLTTRLKDVLEKNVDEKYYLPDERIEKIFNSTFVQEKKCITEPQIIQKFGDRGTSQYSVRDYAHTIPANPMSDRGQMVVEPQIIQNPHGFNKGSIQEDCPAITSSYFQENNYVAEPIIYDDYNSRISADQDAINTLTCNCGASAERNGVKIIEPVIVDAIYNNRPARIYDKTAPTLRSERFGLEVIESGAPRIRWRIRKLTPKETTRLMNFTDNDYEAMARYVSSSAIYKADGNSIVVACLIAIMCALLIKDGYKADIWTKYILHYND